MPDILTEIRANTAAVNALIRRMDLDGQQIFTMADLHKRYSGVPDARVRRAVREVVPGQTRGRVLVPRNYLDRLDQYILEQEAR